MQSRALKNSKETEVLELLYKSTLQLVLKYKKHRTDEIDIENHFCKHTLIEGDVLADKLDSIVFEAKFEASSDGGCIAKITSHNHCKGDVEIKEEEIKGGKEKAAEMCTKLLKPTSSRTLNSMLSVMP
ncbi:hypothetical protein GIB67_024369 [Kingdonia uniflora]|uniref:Bet v I/Major latex protein domain-containing protein n=1 Tax=Kingdonia uniflora TaxID=39325 RepID=A0A7J7LF81_9MAGN|nr:hypothetical protein GIB67_024369 [Kingdonia uniflora]